MLSVSFTVSRDLDEGGEGVILNVLCQVPFAERYVTGGARGGDAFIGRWLYLTRPHAEHVVIVPADRRQTDPWWLPHMDSGGNLNLVYMPRGTSFGHRNLALVRSGSAVCGFPDYIERDSRERRSGTWQTLRMARRAGKLSQWHCVKPPYRGLIERYLREFDQGQALLPGV